MLLNDDGSLAKRLCVIILRFRFVFLAMQGVTTLLYPLSVVKTQQMALASAPRGLRVGVTTACDQPLQQSHYLQIVAGLMLQQLQAAP